MPTKVDGFLHIPSYSLHIGYWQGSSIFSQWIDAIIFSNLPKQPELTSKS